MNFNWKNNTNKRDVIKIAILEYSWKKSWYTFTLSQSVYTLSVVLFFIFYYFIIIMWYAYQWVNMLLLALSIPVIKSINVKISKDVCNPSLWLMLMFI